MYGLEKSPLALYPSSEGYDSADAGRCKALSLSVPISFHAGMTNAEVNNAIDAGYSRWLDCLKNKGRTTGGSQ
jgi:hypothetical protein